MERRQRVLGPLGTRPAVSEGDDHGPDAVFSPLSVSKRRLKRPLNRADGFFARSSKGPSSVTTIRANCPTCGDVQLRATELVVRVCSDDESGSYTFRCPTCAVAVAKGASKRIVDLLVSSGVRMEVWRMPAELAEPHLGPTLQPDDLLDFHLVLESDDWFSELEDLVRRSMPN